MVSPLTTNNQRREYIGDGVYASFDGYQVWIETERGLGFWHAVALEPSVLRALIGYAERLKRPDGREVMRWANQTDSGQNRLAPSDTRSMDRARTYPGIAQAFATQLLLPQMRAA